MDVDHHAETLRGKERERGFLEDERELRLTFTYCGNRLMKAEDLERRGPENVSHPLRERLLDRFGQQCLAVGRDMSSPSFSLSDVLVSID